MTPCYAGSVTKRSDDSATADTLLGDPSSAPGAHEVTRTAAAGSDRASGRADVPEQLGRYVIGEPLGQGGMGQVFRARDPDLNRDVAIKVLHARDDGTDPATQLQQRLLREAQAMAKLSHPNLAVVHDVGASSGQVFLAMELLDGGTLKQWLKDPNRTWRERLEAFVAAGRGLAAAHEAGVIHRDFKPDNVLVSSTGQVKVVDFGLARAVEGPLASPPPSVTATPRPERSGDDVLATPLTMTGAVMGTPAYMSPEQHRGEAATHASDQFSFAVSVFEALYGERPYQGDNVAEIAAAIDRGDLPDTPHADIPASLRAALERALRSRPGDRYPNISELLDRLEAAAVVEEPSAKDRLSRPLVAAAAAVLVAASVGAYLIITSADEETAPADPGISRAVIGDVVRSNRAGIRRCFNDELDRNPDQGQARIVMNFEIAPDGRVISTRFEEGTTVSTDMTACIGGETLRWRFPRPAGGGRVQVKYPVVFDVARAKATKIGERTYRIPASTRKIWREGGDTYLAARVVPSIKDGKPNGIKFYAIKPRSALAQLGIINGDTLLSVNGQPVNLTAADGATKLLDTLSKANKIEAHVTRRGEALTFTYLIE